MAGWGWADREQSTRRCPEGGSGHSEGGRRAAGRSVMGTAMFASRAGSGRGLGVVGRARPGVAAGVRVRASGGRAASGPRAARLRSD